MLKDFLSIPQPKPLPLVGNAASLGQLPIQRMMEFARELRPLYRLTFSNFGFLVASSYEIVEELCDERRFEKLVSGALGNIRDFAGNGLFTVETSHPEWGQAHRI